MKIIIKKVFSQKIAKSYYLTKVEHPPVNNIPCYSLREAEHIRQNSLTVEELEFIYAQKLANSSYTFLPEEIPLKQGEVVVRNKDLPVGTERALKECMEFVESFRPLELLKEEDRKPKSEEYWAMIGEAYRSMIKPTFLIQMSFLASKKEEKKK